MSNVKVNTSKITDIVLSCDINLEDKLFVARFGDSEIIFETHSKDVHCSDIYCSLDDAIKFAEAIIQLAKQ